MGGEVFFGNPRYSYLSKDAYYLPFGAWLMKCANR